MVFSEGVKLSNFIFNNKTIYSSKTFLTQEEFNYLGEKPTATGTQGFSIRFSSGNAGKVYLRIKNLNSGFISPIT